jgi:hypothetical protein
MVEMQPKRLETRDQEAIEKVQDLLDERGLNELFVGNVVYALTSSCDMLKTENVLQSGAIYLQELNKMVEEGYLIVDQYRTVDFEPDSAELTRFTVLVRTTDIIRIPEEPSND